MAKHYERIRRNVSYILNKIKTIHPSQHAKNESIVKELANTLDSMLSSGYSEDEIGEILDMIKTTSIELFNAVLRESKNSVKIRQIYSKYSWAIRLRKAKAEK